MSRYGDMFSEKTGVVALRKQSEGDKGAVTVADFASQLLAEIEGN